MAASLRSALKNTAGTARCGRAKGPVEFFSKGKVFYFLYVNILDIVPVCLCMYEDNTYARRLYTVLSG